MHRLSLESRATGLLRRCGAPLLVMLVSAWAVNSWAGSQETYLECLTNFEPYAESIWHDATYSGAPAQAGYWGDGGSSGNGGIRGNSGVALAYATLVLAQPGHPFNSNRLDRIRRALNYNNATHIVGTNKCVNGSSWGWSSASSTDWQTPEWAATMGLACLLAQSNLPVATVSNTMRVIASEADHRAAIPPASGYVSDTKAEENAWQGNVLALAAAWLSTNASGSNWLWAAKRYCVNSYTVADTSDDPLAAWISTVTLYPSFALQNHGFYHPTYEMVAGMSCGDSLLMARLANTAVAAELQPFAEHNVMAVWTNNLNALVQDSGDFAYPAGLDWELHDFEQNSFITWMATHFNDPLARWTDDKLAQCLRYRQIVNGDGRLVGPSGGGFYREAVGIRRIAFSWLHLANAGYPSGLSTPPGPTLMHNTDVKVIHQRSAFGTFSISYNNSRIMAMIEPAALSTPTNAFMASPKLPGILGLGALGNPTAAQLIGFATNASGFEAEIELTHGSLGTTAIYVKGTGETLALVEVPAPGAGAIATAAASFSCGIENHPLTGGTRLLEWAGGSATLTNRSGVARNVTNDWVCVGGRYGLAAGPGGYFKYQTASSYNRLGAAEDTLQFLSPNPFAPRYAVWLPTKNAAQTAAAAAQISWDVSGTNGTLTFPGPGGAPSQLTAFVPSLIAPTYPPYPLAIAAVSASSAQAGLPATNAVDGDAANYWVSQFGPTNHAEWLKVVFPRSVALSEFIVLPRTENGGYGPSAIQLVVNVTNGIPASGIPASGATVFSGPMQPTALLDVELAQPVYATNAVLVITGSYDRGSTNRPRNTQVVELTFLERAWPNTFGDWAVRQFNATQLADAAISGPSADPEGDGVLNLAEFATGGNPLAPDASGAALQNVPAPAGQFRFRFRERKILADVTRQFMNSTNFGSWSVVSPTGVVTLPDLGEVQWLEATFAAPAGQGFFRVSYGP